MLNISKKINEEIDEKMKKIHKSTEMIKEQEHKRIKDIEARKLDKFIAHHYNIINIKENIKKIYEKEKFRYSNVQENLEDKNKSLVKNQDNIYRKLNQKYKKQKEDTKSKVRYEEFFHRRKISFDRFNENSFIINHLNNSRYDNIIKSQHYRNSKSVERNRSLNTSRDSIRLELDFFPYKNL